jgi:hypothetical protein
MSAAGGKLRIGHLHYEASVMSIGTGKGWIGGSYGDAKTHFCIIRNQETRKIV